MTQSSFIAQTELHRITRLLEACTALAVVVGLAGTYSISGMTAYMLILIPAVLPAFIWLRRGAPGIPIFPIVSLLYVIYFAIPILTANVGIYTPTEILRACASVAGFLLTATLAWRLVGFRAPKHRDARASSFTSDQLLIPFIYSGLILGVVFQAGAQEGWFGWAGPFFGVVRAVSISAASASCFFYGMALGEGKLRPTERNRFLVLFIALIALQLETLLLYGPLMYLGAALFGYIIATKRIPWAALVAVLLVAGVIHMGKGTMRNKYWAPNQIVHVWDAPLFFAEWFNDSLGAIAAGPGQAGGQSLLDRASLLQQLALVQRETPDTTPYMLGATYAYVPLMLVPRFLAPDKIDSQMTLNIMSVRYGLQSVDDIESTTLAWGILPEAFANFGDWGIIGIGAIFGLLTGWFSSRSIGAPVLSLPNLLAITALVTMMNVEVDFGYTMINLWQALIAVTMFYYLLKYSGGGKRAAALPSAATHA